MEKALLITGDTYGFRHEIKALGGKWNRDRAGWVVLPSDQALKIAVKRGFDIEEIEVESAELETPTGERLRAIRQASIDKRGERLRARAARQEQTATAIGARLAHYNDPAFLTQPIQVGHHSEAMHRKLRERLSNQRDRRIGLMIEADNIREEADQVEGTVARIAGDAARADQAAREERDRIITVGSRVRENHNIGEVIRVNKKSYTVRWDSGRTYARDKIFIRPE